MNSFTNFFIEANICLLLLGGFYFLVLNREMHFSFKRFYILLILAISILIPFLRFDNPFSEENGIPFVGQLQTMVLPEIVINEANGPSETVIPTSGFSTALFVGALYVSGVLVLLTVLCFQCFQILKLYRVRKKERTTSGKYTFIPTYGQWPTFSFFNLLFFDNTLNLTAPEKDRILQHEQVHINQRHSLDIVFMELIKILFWINPMVWILKRSLQNIHEFLADERVVKHNDHNEYGSLLAKMAMKQMTLSLGHHFNKSLTLKRIEMMKTPKNKPSVWKWLSVIPMIFIIVFVFSCNDEVMNDVDEVMKTASQSDVPEHLQGALADLLEKYPDAEFTYVKTDVDNEDRLNKLKEIADPSSIGHIRVMKEEGVIELLVNKNGPLSSNISKLTVKGSDKGELFQIVDEPAMPPGGYEEFYQYIANNMKYPAQAKEEGIQGKVYIQFVVEKDGSITEVKAVKGIGGGCDEEAIRVMSSSDRWSIPKQNGHAVRQRIILPVTFRLSGEISSGRHIYMEKNTIRAKAKYTYDHEITGRVLSTETGKPLPGVNVVIKGTTAGTVTDIKGNYKLPAPKDATLIFSFIGKETKLINIDAKSVVDVLLSND